VAHALAHHAVEDLHGPGVRPARRPRAALRPRGGAHRRAAQVARARARSRPSVVRRGRGHPRRARRRGEGSRARGELRRRPPRGRRRCAPGVAARARYARARARLRSGERHGLHLACARVVARRPPACAREGGARSRRPADRPRASEAAETCRSGASALARSGASRPTSHRASSPTTWPSRRRRGVSSLSLFDLAGVLRRPPPEQWLEAFVHGGPRPPLVASARVAFARAAVRGAGPWVAAAVEALSRA
jgi:hypothetical protein